MINPSVYKLWLNLQCQMVTGCKQALLVKHVSGNKDRILAHWPAPTPVTKSLSSVAKNASIGRRLLLEQGPLNSVFLAHPIVVDGRHWGVVALHLLQRSPTAVQAAIKLLKWGFIWLNVVHGTSTPGEADSEPKQAHYQRLLELITSVLQQAGLEPAAITTVNQIAALYGFDRVSLALFSKKRLTLTAVSFNAHFDRRTEEAELIRSAMFEAVEQHTDLTAPATCDFITLNHSNLLAKYQGEFCGTFLLQSPEGLTGALCVERHRKSRRPATDPAELKTVAATLAPILAMRQQSIQAPSAVNSTVSGWFSGAFKHPKALRVLLMAFVAVLSVGSFFPAAYRVKADGVIQSNDRHLLAIPFAGFLAEVLVKPGDQVVAGDLLARLKDDEFALEWRKLTSQTQQLQLEYDSALAQSDRAAAAIVDARLDQTRAQLELAENKLVRTELRAPVTGMIVSEDVRQALGAPLEQGQVLFEIAASGEHIVQIYISEKAIADITPGLPGELRLASLPQQELLIEITGITPLSELRDGDNVFRVEAKLLAPPAALRPGMRGHARILVGERSLGWIWFHGLWYRVRQLLWL